MRKKPWERDALSFLQQEGGYEKNTPDLENDQIVNFTLCKGFERTRRLKAYTFGSIEPILLRHKELKGFDLQRAHEYIQEGKECKVDEVHANGSMKKEFSLLSLMKSLFFTD